ncbi:MAG: V-type ATP synthase subunit I [Planctomycetota bacterium]|nr:MAG: V-type ATP synthase subunit I [Planctomycetota bacterium]
MAITQMAKVMLVTHRSQAPELLEALQRDGICQILNAQQAAVTKDMPELAAAAERPKDLEQLLTRLEKTIEFVKHYARAPKGLLSALAPRTVIDESSYNKTVEDKQIPKIIEKSEQTKTEIERLNSESENLRTTLDHLSPWQSLETPVQEIGRLNRTTSLAALLPAQQIGKVRQQLTDLGAAIETVGSADNKYACIIVAINENLSDVQKLLRSAEFEPVSFEPMTGTVAELIGKYTGRLSETQEKLHLMYEQAAQLGKNLLKLQILYDHYNNLLNREQTKDTAPATESTVILEGWVKQEDYPRLDKIVSSFPASSLTTIKPAEDEEIPVEIENKNVIKPFEVITRLYGMPQRIEVDPTVFLAPFFALFFGLCLTDAGYGLVMVALSIYLLRKLQGDKKFAALMIICSLSTIVCGALTGGWFGDAIQVLNIPWLVRARAAILRFGFDPAQNPKIFFRLALAIGYIQLLTGILVAFFYKLRQRRITEAICAHLTWFVMLNCFAAYFFSTKHILVPEKYGQFFLRLAILPAALIVLFSHNEGGIVGRLGMGVFNLFSSIFYIGDILSYVRLMALGMVTAGLAVAINQFGVMASQVKYVGPLLAGLVLIGGHAFNMGISALGAFVHTLRLQYVEFFPKFFQGGGRLFEPFSKQYTHIYINKG